MQYFDDPPRLQWPIICRRPLPAADPALLSRVDDILDSVEKDGDAALFRLTETFDGVRLNDLAVGPSEFQEAIDAIPPDLAAAIKQAAEMIRTFHQIQCTPEPVVETLPGVRCWRKSVPIEKVGLYIPGGTAPLFSTVLMLGIPAILAGCPEIYLCTPCDKQGKVPAAVLYAAQLLGIRQVFKIGGAQAIAAMAFGTQSIPAVHKIFGPGNGYVTCAKERVLQSGVAIDLPAGPSEVLIIADETAKPEWVAADLLAQAEHGLDSQVVLVAISGKLIEAVAAALYRQVQELPRKALALKALEQSFSVYFERLEDCLAFSNAYAPEHLILAVKNPMDYADKVTNAGSVFLGHYSPETAGDYASGTNHTLPTSGYARAYSGVSLDSFVKKISFQELSASGLAGLAPTLEVLSEAEGLAGHRNAVRIRMREGNSTDS